MIDLAGLTQWPFRVIVLLLGVGAWLLTIAVTDGVACEAHGLANRSNAIQISQAWSPPAPPLVGVHAGYFTIANHSKKSWVIVAVSSPQYEQIAVHRTTLTDGVASMQSVASLPIAAGEQVQFAPGGLHLMMMKAKGKRHEGDSFPITLHFQSGETLAFGMQVTMSERGGHVSVPARDHSMHTPHERHEK